jgi:hypothetical protein
VCVISPYVNDWILFAVFSAAEFYRHAERIAYNCSPQTPKCSFGTVDFFVHAVILSRKSDTCMSAMIFIGRFSTPLPSASVFQSLAMAEILLGRTF